MQSTPRFFQRMCDAYHNYYRRDEPKEEKRVVYQYADDIPKQFLR